MRWLRRQPSPAPAALSLGAHARGRLEPIQAGHHDVEQHDRELVCAQATQRLFARVYANDSMTERLENGLDRQEIRALVIDDEDTDQAWIAQHELPRSFHDQSASPR